MDVRTVIRRAAGFYSDREAVVSGNDRATFGQVWQRGIKLANGLLSLGLEPGDRVGVLEDNCMAAADFFVAAAIANLVRVPLYPRNARSAHAHMLGHTNCRALLTGDHYAHETDGLQEELPDLEHVITRDASYESWVEAQSDVDPDVKVDPDDFFIIRHTGGTTGFPKGVAYTHRTWINAGRDWFYTWPPVLPGDACLHVGPISHGSGYLFLPIWAAGGCSVMVSEFDPEETVDLMEQEKIAFVFLPPTVLNMLSRVPGAAERDWSRLKVVMTGAAPISEDTIAVARRTFGDVLYQGYGQTEALPLVMMGPEQWFAKVEGSNPLRACGVPLPFTDVEIRDQQNRPLPPNQEGEIVTRCDGMMAGFWNDPAETKKRMIDGWVRTGDIGYIDRHGYLYVCDRKDDMIISGGFNIYPAELENVIANHPAVIEAAVFGIPHEKWGETPMAVCVVDGRTSVTEQEIIELCTEQLGSYKKPAKVLLTTDPLPKSVVGKILRKDLRSPYWEGRDRQVGGA